MTTYLECSTWIFSRLRGVDDSAMLFTQLGSDLPSSWMGQGRADCLDARGIGLAYVSFSKV